MKDEHWIDRVSSGSVANVLGSPIASPSVREVIDNTSLPHEELIELASNTLDNMYNAYFRAGWAISDNGPGSGGFYLRNQLMDMYALEYERRHGRVVRFDPKADLKLTLTALKTLRREV